MSLKPFAKIPLNNSTISDNSDIIRVVNLIQNNVSDSLNPVITNAANDIITLTQVSLIAGQVNVINHTLGRILKSWSAAPYGPAMIWKDPGTSQTASLNNQSPNKTIWLWTSANVIIDLNVW